MTSGHISLMKQKKVSALKKSSTPTGLVWNTNMADFSLFRYTNIADMTSSENSLFCFPNIGPQGNLSFVFALIMRTCARHVSKAMFEINNSPE